MTRQKRVLSGAFAAILLLAALAAGVRHPHGSGSDAPCKFSAQMFDTFDTLVEFTAFTEGEIEFDRHVAAVRDEMERLHKLFDIYNKYDGIVNIKSLNDAAGTEPLVVDPAIVELLEIAKEAYEETGGAVNVTLGPVLALWHDCRERAASGDISTPPLPLLQAAAAHVSPHDIVIDRGRSTVLLRHRDMRLDVGAMAKGYAVQKTVEHLREAGLQSGLINAGGNVVVIGPPLDGREAWNIGVHAPVDDLSKLADVLLLPGGAVVTSGNDQRYYLANGKRYHHIIDPQTLHPAEGVRSVSVLHPDSTTADVLSTAAFIMPLSEAKKLIAEKGAEAIWILSDGTEAITAGYYRLSKHRTAPDTAAPAHDEGGLRIEGPEHRIEGASVILSNAGTYILSGTHEGIVVVDAPGEKVELILTGVSIFNPDGPAIAFDAASEAIVTLLEGTENALADGGADQERDAALFSSVPLTIGGSGKLRVHGSFQEGIASDATLVVNSGDFRITAVDDGLNAGLGIVVNGGNIHIDAGGDAIDSNADLTINGGTLTLLAGMSPGAGGLDADEGEIGLLINGGFVVATGYSNTAPNPASGQKSMLLEFATDQAAETVVQIRDKEGKEIVTFSPTGKFREFLFSSEALEAGRPYHIYLNGVRQTHFRSEDEDFVIAETVGEFIVGQD